MPCRRRPVAGGLGDVLRLAVPKRHATAERRSTGPAPHAVLVTTPEPGPGPLPRRPGLLRRVAAGEGPAAAGRAAGPHDRRGLAGRPGRRRGTALAAGRGALVVVPDHRDVERLDGALTALSARASTCGYGRPGTTGALHRVAQGPPRSRRCVVGTRAAAFAPVHDLGLVAWWDDGDDLLAEPRAPYHHGGGWSLGLPSEATGAALLAGGFGRSLRLQMGIEAGGSRPGRRRGPRRCAPPRRACTIAGEGADEERDGPAARAHIPSRAWRVAKDALVDGPVLVQVPRRGYQPSLSCAECRTPVRCPAAGPGRSRGLRGGPRLPLVRRLRSHGFECEHCGSRRLRSAVTGARRTAEEIGRAFPGMPVHTSGSGDVLPPWAPNLRSSSPRPAPSRSPRAATRPCCSSTPGPGSTCPASTRRRGAASVAGGRRADPARAGRGHRRPRGRPHAFDDAGRRGPRALGPRLARLARAGRAPRAGLPPAMTMAQVVGPRGPLVAAVDAAGLGPTVERLGPLPFRSPTAGQSSPTTGGPPLAQVLLRVPRERTPRPRASPGRHAGGAFGPQGTGVGVGAHGPRRGSGLSLELPPAAGPIVSDDLPEHRQQRRPIERLALLHPDRTRGLLACPAVMMPSGSGTMAPS